jgi:myo-inositol-1(or 4)-monophosphatase
MVRSGTMEAVRRDRAFLAEVEETAAGIAGRAGALLVECYHQPVVVEFKDEKRTDPVTQADRSAEQLVRAELRRAFPGHGILGEEGTSDATTSEYVWILDPLDGTANFAGKLPFFGLSLALLRNGVPVVGCLYVPFGPLLRPGVLRASFGNGASIDGSPLVLERRPFNPGGPAALPPSFPWVFKLRGEFAKRPGELRNLGSISFELAMVAGGGFQYAAFVRPRAWDVAAGILLVREAGGAALTWERGGWRPFDRFAPPARRRDGKVPTLRDWGRPILVCAPGASPHLVDGFGLRPPPPRAVRWLVARGQRARRWWHRRRHPEEQAKDGSARPAAS